MYIIVCSQDKLCIEIANTYSNIASEIIILKDFDFPGDEFHIGLPDNIRMQEEAIIIINLFKAKYDYMKLFLILNLLSDLKIIVKILIIPYLSYLKHHVTDKYYYSDVISMLYKMFSIFNITAILTLDLYREGLPFNIMNIPIIDIFRKSILTKAIENSVLIAPDNNAFIKIKHISQILRVPCISMYKDCNRKVNISSCEKEKLIQYINSTTRVMIIDDVLVTGNTINQVIKILNQFGIKKIDCYITHIIQSSAINKYLNKLNRIFTCNPIKDVSYKIHYVPTAFLWKNYLNI